MAKYASQAALALRLIKAKGALVTFTRASTYIDPVTQAPSGSDLTYTAQIAALPLSASKARHIFGDGADITKPRLSLSAALSGVAQELKIGDRFVWSGKRYGIVAIERLDPAGEGAVYASGYAEAA